MDRNCQCIDYAVVVECRRGPQTSTLGAIVSHTALVLDVPTAEQGFSVRVQLRRVFVVAAISFYKDGG